MVVRNVSQAVLTQKQSHSLLFMTRPDMEKGGALLRRMDTRLTVRLKDTKTRMT